MAESAFGTPQTILVVGGDSDIGVAIARRFVADGSQRVILAGRNPDALRERAASLACDTRVVRFDVVALDEHAAFVEQACGDGDVDLVVVAVGQLLSRPDAVADPVRAAAMAQANYVGPMALMLRLGERLRAQAHGTLLVLSSVAAVRARPDNYVYGSTKAALDTFAQGMAFDLEGTGARVVIVRPGFVRSKMTTGMSGPLAVTPEDVAEAVARRLRTGPLVIWVPFALAVLGNVLRFLPRKVLARLAS